VAIFTKSPSVNEKVASGFPPSYGPKFPNNKIPKFNSDPKYSIGNLT